MLRKGKARASRQLSGAHLLSSDYKVIWEQKVGKGSLLSIGCFLRPSNYNTKILNRFTASVVNWSEARPKALKILAVRKAEVLTGGNQTAHYESTGRKTLRIE